PTRGAPTGVASRKRSAAPTPIWRRGPTWPSSRGRRAWTRGAGSARKCMGRGSTTRPACRRASAWRERKSGASRWPTSPGRRSARPSRRYTTSRASSGSAGRSPSPTSMSASSVTPSATSIASPASIRCGSGRRNTCPRRRWRSTRTRWAISRRSPEAGGAMALMIRAVGCLVPAGLPGLPVSARAQDPPRRGGEIRVATYGDPGTLDPHITTDVPALRIRNQVCETLITWDAQTKESPMLADSWENSADGTVWTFKLRRGVKFHGGQTMRAADVKYSFERILKVSPRKTDYHMIKEIKAPDDHTVQFVLSARTSAFFPALAMYWAQVVEAASTEKQVKET